MADAKEQLRSEVSQRILFLIEGGLRQSQIAESIGVSNAVISLLKTDKYNADGDAIYLKYKNLLDSLLSNLGLDIDSKSQQKIHTDEETYSDWLVEQIQFSKVTPIELADKAKVSAQAITLILNGTTSNPQKGTKDKIEKALKELNATHPIFKEKKTDQPVIFSGLPYTDSEISQVPNMKGVYAVHDRRGYPLYIGKGNLKDRLSSHKRDIGFQDPKIACTFSYIVLQKSNDPSANKEADKEAIWLEKVLIKFAGNSVLLNIKLASDISEKLGDPET